MKRGRTASQLGVSSSCRTRTAVMATRCTALTTATTGTPVWAETQARQVAPEVSPWACTWTACAHTANSTSTKHTVVAHNFQRNSNLVGVFLMGLNKYAELYN